MFVLHLRTPSFQVTHLLSFSNKQPIDFDGDPTLFHFLLLKSVGKGAFGKVGSSLRLGGHLREQLELIALLELYRSGSFNTKRLASSMPLSTSTKRNVCV